jgi:hypothetical protein
MESPEAIQTEQRYSPARVARLLEMDRSTIIRLRDLYYETGGAEGLGPWEKHNAKGVRIRANVLNAYCDSKQI